MPGMTNQNDLREAQMISGHFGTQSTVYSALTEIHPAIQLSSPRNCMWEQNAEAKPQQDEFLSNIQMVLDRDFRMDIPIEHKHAGTEYSKC